MRPPEADTPGRSPAYAEFHAPPLDGPAQPEARIEAQSLLGNPPFYDVDGRRYFVRSGGPDYMERGMASWYGRPFHGRKTANGERYDMHGLTAAHRTLPLPTDVRVTNLENGRSVTVRVNDRGPFKDDRILDLSYAAAQELGMLKTGVAMIELHTLTQPRPPPGQAIEDFRLYAQVGAFADGGNAARIADQLRGLGFDEVEVRPATRDGIALSRVLVGPAASATEFDDLVARLRGAGFDGARLALD